MNKAVLHSAIVLALLLAVTFTFATPISASDIRASKETDPLDGVYYVGDTIYYQMTVMNPVDNTAVNTLTRIWDTLPNGTVIEFLGSGDTLVQEPGQSQNYTAQYVVAEADIVWLDALGHYGVRNRFELLGYDSTGDDVQALVTRNSRVIWPDTEVTINALPIMVAAPGDSASLTVREKNTGYDPLFDVYVQILRNGSPHASLDDSHASWSSDGNQDGILDPGETWTWTIDSGPITETTTFTALGHGFDPMDKVISFDTGYLDERDEVTVTVFTTPPVGGQAFPANRLGILLPFVALGAAILAGAVIFARRRQALG